MRYFWKIEYIRAVHMQSYHNFRQSHVFITPPKILWKVQVNHNRLTRQYIEHSYKFRLETENGACCLSIRVLMNDDGNSFTKNCVAWTHTNTHQPMATIPGLCDCEQTSNQKEWMMLRRRKKWAGASSRSKFQKCNTSSLSEFHVRYVYVTRACWRVCHSFCWWSPMTKI